MSFSSFHRETVRAQGLSQNKIRSAGTPQSGTDLSSHWAKIFEKWNSSNSISSEGKRAESVKF